MNRVTWMKQGADRVREAVERKPNVGVAKNVILMVGDGMGVSTVTGTRILAGQLQGATGEEYRLHMERMPYTGLAKTYNTNQQTPDSAGTATAFLSGVKTRAAVLGVDERVAKGDCTHLHEAKLETMVDWALAAGKSVGIVTTARVTHATPGAAYAKIPHRYWETDADIASPHFNKEMKNCDSSLKDIALQLIEDNHRIHVVMGGGRRSFTPITTRDPVNDKPGRRLDGRDLIKEWQDTQESKGAKHSYVWNADQLKDVKDDVDYLLGLFDYSSMAYDADRIKSGPASQPSLSEMTEKAIKILQKNDRGYFLFVEGSNIDIGHHANQAHVALLEGVALDKAVKTVGEVTNERDTLTIVTADHSHVFNIAGYQDRGHSIFGTFYGSGKVWDTPIDGKAMTTIIYGNGPGPGRDLDVSTVDTEELNFRFPAAVPIRYETHGGEDVSVYAQGPMAHLLTGNWEQNYIAHVMAYSACVGPGSWRCEQDHARITRRSGDGLRNSGLGIRGSSVFVFVVVVGGLFLL